MGKDQISQVASTTRRKWTEAELQALLKDGWYFRVKKSKGRDYITRRKGQTERSLGPFDEDLWNLIKRTRVDEASENGTYIQRTTKAFR